MVCKKTGKFIFVLLSILSVLLLFVIFVYPHFSGVVKSPPVSMEIEARTDQLRNVMAIYYSENDSYPWQVDNWEQLVAEFNKHELDGVINDKRTQELFENYEVEFNINIDADDYTIFLTSNRLNKEWKITDSKVEQLPREEEERNYIFYLLVIVLGAVLIEIIVSLLTKFDVLSKD